MPDRLPASSGGDVPGFMMVGTHPDTGQLFAVSNNDPVGWGATANHDGMNAATHVSGSTGRITPIEVLEARRRGCSSSGWRCVPIPAAPGGSAAVWGCGGTSGS